MKLLICSDGSEQADQAVKLGASVAAACSAEVTLLGIMESPGASQAILESLQRGQSLLQDKKIQAELITKAGKPVEEIARKTEETAYDLVVIGAVRKESRGLFWLSSKTYKIIKETKPPVLSVVGKAAPFQKILICSGGKQYIESALRLAGQIARGMGASATLLHVMPELPVIYQSLPRMEETVARVLESSSELGKNLRSEKETLEREGVPTEVRLRNGLVLEEILGEIEENNYDLVVTGSALSRSLRTYVMGDVTREVLNRTTCPVLVGRSEPRPLLKTLLNWWR